MISEGKRKKEVNKRYEGCRRVKKRWMKRRWVKDKEWWSDRKSRERFGWVVKKEG